MIGKKIKKKKKVTKKNEGEASNPEKLQCTSSTGEDAGSKSGSGDDSSKSKAGSGDDSGSKSDPVRNTNIIEIFRYFIYLSMLFIVHLFFRDRNFQILHLFQYASH